MLLSICNRVLHLRRVGGTDVYVFWAVWENQTTKHKLKFKEQNTMATQNTKQSNKTATKQETSGTSSLFSIYGARLSKSGKRLNISLCRTGEDGKKEWQTVSISLDSNTTPIKLKDDFAFIKIKRLDTPVLEDEQEIGF